MITQLNHSGGQNRPLPPGHGGENPGNHYGNDKDNPGNHYGHDKDNGNPKPGWKHQYKREYMEQNFVVDITSPYNDVLMIYGDHYQIQRYTYGLDRISMDMWMIEDHNNGWRPRGSNTHLAGTPERLYYLQDELGSTTKLIGEDGKTSAHYNYDEFGRPLSFRKFDQNWPGPDNTFDYTGYQYDTAAEMWYAQARYYAPKVGRFVSEDPWPGTQMVPNTMNPYPYVLNNPLKYVDPLGLWNDCPTKDAVSILALEELFSAYKLENNTSGMDATMREIQRIQQKNNISIEDYAFASEKKTTRVSIDYVQIFKLEDIHQLHKQDDKKVFLAGLVPGVGPALGGLASTVAEQEQNGKVSGYNATKNIALGVLNIKKPASGFIASAGDTGYNLVKDKNDTYNRDGITIQENDIYVQIKTATNQGLKTATVKVYIRNDEILLYQEFNSDDITVPSYPSYEKIIKSKWKKEGYE